MSILERIGCKILDVVIFLLKVLTAAIKFFNLGLYFTPIALVLSIIIGLSAWSFKAAVITFIVADIIAALGYIARNF